MSPNLQTHGKKISVPDNLYTAILAIALLIVLATAGITAYMCYARFGSFTIPS
jgi:hypothetical protein